MRRAFVWIGRLAITGFVLALIGAGALAYVIHRYSQDLPDYQRLADYTPPTVTRIHAGDGRLLAEYAHEKRVFVPIEAMPQHLKQAFVAAEDQHFYSHPGIDITGIARAVVDNISRLWESRRPQGASTITQQVAKNFLLTNEVSIERKIKEAVLAFRMESTFSKDRILELYLNEIFLGRRSYGVAAAALNYFDKSLDDLTLSETAFLAGLPKAPSHYDPERQYEAAIGRRDYVIGRMLDDGYISRDEAEVARAEPLVLHSRSPEDYAYAPFFTEEVRRQLVARYGEEGFYGGGLSVRTTVDPRLQAIADRSLRRGLGIYDRQHKGWRGALAQIELKQDLDWSTALERFDPGFELFDLKLAVVLGVERDVARVGLASGERGTIALSELTWARQEHEDGSLGPAVRKVGDVLSVGDVVLVEPVREAGATTYGLRQRPAVEGAAVAIDPHTGRVLAMSGGFSFRQSQFNRATQALRQPGSAFKPFVYLAALEAGYTPASMVLDAPITVDQGPDLPPWRPENYSERFYGPSTLRLGLEKSRNVMTVRLALDVGMDRVIDVARRFGIDRGLQGYPAASLGSNEVTPLGLTTAYTMLLNGGKRTEPYLVDRIQDPRGNTIYRRDQRGCDCSGYAYDGGLPPNVLDSREQVTDPRLAYQMVAMLEGVVERGTAAAARTLKRPLAGKTGTTNESRDAWFVGFSPDLVVGVFVGYDQPTSLGDRTTGGTVALPIWIDLMKEALEGQPPTPFRTPPGLQLVQIDATTGRLPGPDTSQIISEPFLPGTEPVSSFPASMVGEDDRRASQGGASRGRPRSPMGSGGLY